MGDPYVALGYAVTYGSMLIYAVSLARRVRRRDELIRSLHAGPGLPGSDNHG